MLIITGNVKLCINLMRNHMSSFDIKLDLKSVVGSN